MRGSPSYDPPPVDDFHDVNRPAMACGDFMWRGVAVVVSDVPRLHVGDEIVPRHPVVRWLCRFRPVRALGVRPFRPGSRIEEEQAVRAAGKLFVSPRGWEQLKEVTRR